jgi:outer membrane protein
MRFEQQTPMCLRVVAAALLITFLSASGRGVFASEQTPQQRPQPVAQPPVAPPAAQGQTGPTIRIGQDEAVRMALENNLGIQTERLNPQIQSLGVSRALSVFTPEVFGGTSRSSVTTPPTDFLSQGVDVTTTGTVNAGGGVRQILPWGADYSVGINGVRATSDAPRTPFSPQLQSDMTAIYNQPLLRDLRMDSNRQAILQSRNQQSVADIQLTERVTQTSRVVRISYFNLIAAISGLQVAQQSLDLARQSLKNNQRRVEVGMAAPIDIISAEAEVARNEESVILRQGDIEAAQDALRTLIMNPSQPDFWTTRIEPSEQPVLSPQAIDVETAITNAYANRTDIAQLKKTIESAEINIKFNENQKLPAIDLQARYGLRGVGGVFRQFDPNTPIGENPAVVRSSARSFGDVLRDVFGNDFNSWTFALNVSYPIGTSVADAALAQSRLQRQQGQVAMRNLETEVARQVREAGRQVATTLKRVEATKKARELAERSLEAEEKRLQVGMSDSYRLFQFQRDLASARQNELNAIIAYNRALVSFESVQIVPVNGGGGGGF